MSSCSHCSFSFPKDVSSAQRLQRHTSSCHYWLHAFYEADGGALLGVSERSGPSGNLVCFVPGCSFEEANASVLTSHVRTVHCEGHKVSCRVSSWDHLDDPSLADLRALAVQGPSRSAEVALPSSSSSSSSSHATSSSAQASTAFACGSQPAPSLQASQRGPSTVSQTQPSTPEPSPPPAAQRRSLTSIDRRKSLPSLSSSRAHPYRSSPSSSHSTSPSSSGRSSPLHVHPTPVHPSPLVNVAFSAPQSPTAAAADDEDSMDVNEEPDRPTDEQEFLRQLSLSLLHLDWVIVNARCARQVFTCIQCRCGLSTRDLLHHVKEHGIPVDKQAEQRLLQIVEQRAFVTSTRDAPPPQAKGGPIPELEVQAGWACSLCTYCATKYPTIESHWSRTHRGLGSAVQGTYKAKVQTIFRRHPQYFEVLIEKANVAPDSAFSLFLDQIAPAIDASTLVNPPVSVKEVPPILQLMQWHEHLSISVFEFTVGSNFLLQSL